MKAKITTLYVHLKLFNNYLSLHDLAFILKLYVNKVII